MLYFLLHPFMTRTLSGFDYWRSQVIRLLTGAVRGAGACLCVYLVASQRSGVTVGDWSGWGRFCRGVSGGPPAKLASAGEPAL